MVKIVIAFIVIAAAAFYLLSKSGGDVSMGGEQHGAEATHMESAPASTPAPALDAAPASAPAAAPASAP